MNLNVDYRFFLPLRSTATNLITIILLVGFNSGCQKDPAAHFNTDKNTYTAGETVHCFDASENAYSWLWTTPDNQSHTSQNIDFVIDSNDFGGIKTFTLEVHSKNGRKSDKTSGTITVNQYMLSSDYFAVGSTVYYPTSKDSRAINAQGAWLIGASLPVADRCVGRYLTIYLPGVTPPSSGGIFSLQSDPLTLTAGKAYISVSLCSDPDVLIKAVANSGQLIISMTTTGKIHATFSNVNATETWSGSNPTPVIISGDITCR